MVEAEVKNCRDGGFLFFSEGSRNAIDVIAAMLAGDDDTLALTDACRWC
ncbi:hypothetical protein [Herbaspirillum lusitanum]|nr:hypothetical protein [Herbaspirillum lusitanum]